MSREIQALKDAVWVVACHFAFTANDKSEASLRAMRLCFEPGVDFNISLQALAINFLYPNFILL